MKQDTKFEWGDEVVVDGEVGRFKFVGPSVTNPSVYGVVQRTDHMSETRSMAWRVIHAPKPTAADIFSEEYFAAGNTVCVPRPIEAIAQRTVARIKNGEASDVGVKS